MEFIIHRCTLLIAGSALFAAAAITIARRPDGFETAIHYAAVAWLFAIADTVEWMIDAFVNPPNSGAIYRNLLSAPLSLLVPLAMTIAICFLRRLLKNSVIRYSFFVVLPCCIAMVDVILLLWESAEVTAAVEQIFDWPVR